MKMKLLENKKKEYQSKKYSKEEIDWIEQYYYNHSKQETLEEFNKIFDKNVSFQSLNSIIFKTGIRKGKNPNDWQPEEDEWLKENKGNLSCEELTKLFNNNFNKNRTENALYKRFRVLGLSEKMIVYSQEEIDWLKNNYKDNQTYKEISKNFKNKFNKEINYKYISKIFKRDGVQKKRVVNRINAYEIGKEFIHKGEYTFIKVNDKANNGENNYVRKQRMIWEQHFGKIPKGYYIIFKDNDPTNFDIKNLACVSKRTNFFLNKHDLKNKGEITETTIKLCELMDETSKNHEYICQIKNGKVIKRFISVKEAVKETGINRMGIQRCLRGIRKTANGYEWKYDC